MTEDGDDNITKNQNPMINFHSGVETETQWLVTHKKYLNIGSTGGGFLLVTDCTTTWPRSQAITQTLLIIFILEQNTYIHTSQYMESFALSINEVCNGITSLKSLSRHLAICSDSLTICAHKYGLHLTKWARAVLTAVTVQVTIAPPLQLVTHLHLLHTKK